MIIKEYVDEATKIRIHDDYISIKEEEKEIKETIISLILKKIKKIHKDIFIN